MKSDDDTHAAFENPLDLEDEKPAEGETSSANPMSLDLRDEEPAEGETSQTKDTAVLEQQPAPGACISTILDHCRIMDVPRQ